MQPMCDQVNVMYRSGEPRGSLQKWEDAFHCSELPSLEQMSVTNAKSGANNAVREQHISGGKQSHMLRMQVGKQWNG